MPGKSLFPPLAIGEARQIAKTIAEKNAGQPMRRLDVFHELGKSPDSGPSRFLVTASSGFGLTTGGYQAETLSLTDLGRRLAVDSDETAVIDAVLRPEVFRKFFDTYSAKPVPSEVAARSFLADAGIPTDRTQNCLDLILENGRQSGLIDEVSGMQRILARDHAIEKKGGKPKTVEPRKPRAEQEETVKEDGGRAQTRALPSLNVNLEIHLPADAKPEVYESIFRSMRKHLVDVE